MSKGELIVQCNLVFFGRRMQEEQRAEEGNLQPRWCRYDLVISGADHGTYIIASTAETAYDTAIKMSHGTNSTNKQWPRNSRALGLENFHRSSRQSVRVTEMNVRCRGSNQPTTERDENKDGQYVIE